MKVTVLSYGGGQNSTALLYKCVFDEDFRAKYAPDRFLVVMADTGDEHPHTYKHIKSIKEFCFVHKINFVFITNDMGFHEPGWSTLRYNFKTEHSIASKTTPKFCHNFLKHQVILNYLEHWLRKEFGFRAKKRRVFSDFILNYGKIKMLVGIGKDESIRVNRNKQPQWQEKAIKTLYPLIDIGLDRKGCQDYIRSLGLSVPFPSYCMLCPYLDEKGLLWLKRFHPDDYEEWEQYETEKIKHWACEDDPSKIMTPKGKIKPNYTIWGKKRLSEKLKEAVEKYGHMSDEELNEYKFSYGCTQIRY